MKGNMVFVGMALASRTRCFYGIVESNVQL